MACQEYSWCAVGAVIMWYNSGWQVAGWLGMWRTQHKGRRTGGQAGPIRATMGHPATSLGAFPSSCSSTSITATGFHRPAGLPYRERRRNLSRIQWACILNSSYSVFLGSLSQLILSNREREKERERERERERDLVQAGRRVHDFSLGRLKWPSMA